MSDGLKKLQPHEFPLVVSKLGNFYGAFSSNEINHSIKDKIETMLELEDDTEIAKFG